jgi:hypothetical protein
MPKFFKKRIGIIIIVFVVFIAGLGLGLAIDDIPFFGWDRKVGVSDLANLLLTVIVGFLIPVSLSPLITNKRNIKDFLIDETKDCLAFLAQIKAEIDKAALDSSATTPEITRRKINSMVSPDLGMKLTSLSSQLEISFEKESYKLRQGIDEQNREYWVETTGGGLMTQNFKIDINYYVSHNKSYAKIVRCLKSAVHEINNY